MALSKKQKIIGLIVALVLIGLGILTALGEFPPEDLSGKFRNKNRINTVPVVPAPPTYNITQPAQPFSTPNQYANPEQYNTPNVTSPTDSMVEWDQGN